MLCVRPYVPTARIRQQDVSQPKGPPTPADAPASGSPDLAWSCDWPTVQEILEDSAISWKQYNPSSLDLLPEYALLSASPMWNPALYSPENPISFSLVNYVQWYFKSFKQLSSPLYQKAFLPTFPGEFHQDVMRGTLPQVSWLAPPEGWDAGVTIALHEAPGPPGAPPVPVYVVTPDGPASSGDLVIMLMEAKMALLP